MQCNVNVRVLESGRQFLQRFGGTGTSGGLQLQAVRWARVMIRRRKPWWLPTANSKIFRIPVLRPVPKEVEDERKRLENNYAAYDRSFRAFVTARFEESEALSKTHAQETTEEAEIERITALIEKDNNKVRAIREEALVVEWKNMEYNIIETRKKFEEEEAAKLAETKILLESELGRLKLAIPLEKFDEAIEKALASDPVDYNFSIDKKGNKYYGRYTKAPEFRTQTHLQNPQDQLSAKSSL